MLKLPLLYSRTSTGAIQTWLIEIEDNKYRTITGQLDGKLITNSWTVCSGKNDGKANATSDEMQAQREAQALWQKKKDSGYCEDVKHIDIEVYTEPMLAKKWEDYQDKVTFPLYSQPKLDGIRCIVKRDGMWSRNGKKIVSAPHIFESLSHIFDDHPGLILDGELYCDKFANDFNAICSLVKKTRPTFSDLVESRGAIQYHIYDIVNPGMRFTERFEVVEATVEKANNKCIQSVSTVRVDSKFLLTEWYEKYVDAGYEGQMVRLDAHYENKRSKHLLKRKEWLDEEFIITKVIEGEGNLTGMVGALAFNNKNGKEFTSSVNGTREYSKELWEDRINLIGKSATIKFFNYTPDGKPRFPKVTKIDRESYE